MDKKKPDIAPYIYERNAIASARYSFSLFEQRVFFKILSLIDPKNPESLNNLQFNIKDLMLDIDTVSNKAYEKIKNAARDLRKREIHIKLKNGNDFYTGVFNDVEANSNDGFVKVTINDKLKDQYINLSGEFTKFKLCYVLNLSNPNAMRLYEVLNQYRKIGKRIISIQELRYIFDVENKYPEYGEFKRRIILPSIKEVNKHTDLKVDYIQKTKNRRIHEIHFIFETQEPKEPLLKLEPSNTKIDSTIIGLYTVFNNAQAEEYEKKFSLEYIKENLQHAKKIFKPDVGTIESCLKSCLDKDRAGFNMKKVKTIKAKDIENLKKAKEQAEQQAIEEEKKEHEKILNSIPKEEYDQMYISIRKEFIDKKIINLNFSSQILEKMTVELEIVKRIKQRKLTDEN